jgi:hypothetical protein
VGTRSTTVIRVEETLKNDKHVLLTIVWPGSEPVRPEAKTRQAGLIRGAATRVVNLRSSRLVAGCIGFLVAAKILWCAVLKLWLFEPQNPTFEAFPIPRSDCFSSAALLLSLRRSKPITVGKGHSQWN